MQSESAYCLWCSVWLIVWWMKQWWQNSDLVENWCNVQPCFMSKVLAARRSECVCLHVSPAMADFYPLSVPPLNTTSSDELVSAVDGSCQSSLLNAESPSSLSSVKQEPADVTVSASCFQDHDNGAIADSNSCTAGQQPFIACRVCGDKASGYHYGVTSCEGCKVSCLILLLDFSLCIMRESSYCFQRVLAIAILSVRSSVCHTGGSVKNDAS